MGYDARHHGRIDITPPLSWPELQAAPTLSDLELIRDVAVEETATGQVSTITGVALAAITRLGPFPGAHIEEELRAFVAAFPGREFAGAITADGPDGDHWRYLVLGGGIVQEEARLVWPSDEPAVAW